METGRCKLCGEERQLCNSHIIPEFFYASLYEKGRLHEHDRETGEITYAQKGHREPLLCKKCESDLNDRYEDYVKEALYDHGKLPKTVTGQNAIRGLDYRRFKLCMLSILWRASVATLEFFENVALGPRHEAAIRQMILTDDPGDEDLYPFRCAVLWLPDAKTNLPYVVRGAAMQPVSKRFNHKHVYRFTFGNCLWDFLVGTDPTIRLLSIRKNGTLPIHWMPCHKTEIWPFIRDTERARARHRT